MFLIPLVFTQTHCLYLPPPAPFLVLWSQFFLSFELDADLAALKQNPKVRDSMTFFLEISKTQPATSATFGSPIGLGCPEFHIF